MKDKLQIFMIVLLAAVIIMMGIMLSGQRQMVNDIDRFSDEMISVKNNLAQQSNFNDDFITVHIRDEFPKSINPNEDIEGVIYFELTSSKDIDEVYVVLEEEKSKDIIKAEAQSLGGLKYKAEITLERADNFTYYAVGVSEDGVETMLSDKQHLSLKGRIVERAYLFRWANAVSDRKYSIDGIIAIDETKAKVEKIELKVAMEYDYIGYKDDYEQYVLDTIDITNSIKMTDRSEVKDMPFYDVESYDIYSFDVSGRFDEDEFNRKRGFDFVVVVTYADNYVVEMFAHE